MWPMSFLIFLPTLNPIVLWVSYHKLIFNPLFVGAFQIFFFILADDQNKYLLPMQQNLKNLNEKYSRNLGKGKPIRMKVGKAFDYIKISSQLPIIGCELAWRTWIRTTQSPVGDWRFYSGFPGPTAEARGDWEPA